MWCTESERNMSFITQNEPLTYIRKAKALSSLCIHAELSMLSLFAWNSVTSIKTGIQNSIRWPRWLSWMRVRLVIRRLRIRSLLGRQHSFVEIDHEIISRVILSLPLIQEGQLSISGEIMCTLLVRLEDSACPITVRLSKPTALDPNRLTGP